MSSLIHSRHRAFGPLAEEFNALLRRYPHVGRDGIEQMIDIFPKLSILEMSLLSADDELGESFHDFHRAHRERLKPSWAHDLIFALVMFGSLGLIGALAWGLSA